MLFSTLLLLDAHSGEVVAKHFRPLGEWTVLLAHCFLDEYGN